jgi:hypothetical protein
LDCELGICEPVIASKLCKVESAELRYFELAIGDAIAQEIIEPCVARAEALTLRAAMQGILARARMLGEPDELSSLTSLPITVLRLNPKEKQWRSPLPAGSAAAALSPSTRSEVWQVKACLREQFARRRDIRASYNNPN